MLTRKLTHPLENLSVYVVLVPFFQYVVTLQKQIALLQLQSYCSYFSLTPRAYLVPATMSCQVQNSDKGAVGVGTTVAREVAVGDTADSLIWRAQRKPRS